MTKTEQRTGAMSSTSRLLPVAIAVAVVLFVAYSAIRVNWLPVITPDGLNYLEHSNDLFGLGFVQLGFRQFGYPTWLAFIDAVAQMASVQPLALTVILQHLLLFFAVGITIWVLRWWSAPTVLVLLTPSMVAYSNFILTESVAVPLTVVGAAACVVLISSRTSNRTTAWVVLAATVGTLLPMIRLHYATISFAIAVALFAALRLQRESRRAITVALASGGVVLSLLVGGMTIENYRESGVLAPSIGSERAMFWAAWVTIGLANEEAVAEAMPEVYLEGETDAFIRKMNESGLSAGEQRPIYASAVNRIFEATGASKTRARINSLGGVFIGGRLDDLGSGLNYIAAPDHGEDLERAIHLYGGNGQVDRSMIADQYNNGILPTPIVDFAASVPSPPSPSIALVLVFLIPLFTVASTYLLWFKHSRLLAILGLVVLIANALASFAFLTDNVRYLLPAYLFFVTITLGAAREYWTFDRSAFEKTDVLSR
jgi:hypothetical protein